MDRVATFELRESITPYGNASILDSGIDHILYPHNVAHGSTKVRVKANSGRVRTDLVSIQQNGKDRDSDHCPIAVTVLV